MPDKKDIRSNVLKVFEEKKARSGTTRLRAVDWIIDGKHYPLLEKREFFEKDGQEKIGKAKGMNLNDMLIVKDNFPEILTLLQALPNDDVDAAAPESKPAGPATTLNGHDEDAY